MGKLHELLAVEKTALGASEKLFQETLAKFARVDNYFKGHIKTLKMLDDTPANKALESSSRQEKALPTTVPATLEYLFGFWAKSEDVLFQKNKTNQMAMADIEFNGSVLVKNVPVDELLGLENRLEKLRGMFATIPTLDASKTWELDVNAATPGTWVVKNDDETIKTEKIVAPVVLYEATDKHPAQVKEFSKDIVVGKFITKDFSGAITALQKANLMETLDSLLVEVKKARVRANDVTAVADKIGNIITNLFMDVLK